MDLIQNSLETLQAAVATEWATIKTFSIAILMENHLLILPFLNLEWAIMRYENFSFFAKSLSSD